MTCTRRSEWQGVVPYGDGIDFAGSAFAGCGPSEDDHVGVRRGDLFVGQFSPAGTRISPPAIRMISATQGGELMRGLGQVSA